MILDPDLPMKTIRRQKGWPNGAHYTCFHPVMEDGSKGTRNFFYFNPSGCLCEKRIIPSRRKA